MTAGASSPPTTKFLSLWWTIRNGSNSLEDLKKKCLYFSTKQKNSLNIQGLLCRIEEIKISIILPSIIKTPLIYWVFAELKKWLCYSTKQKKKPWISWVFWTESRPRMLENRSQGWFSHQWNQIVLGWFHQKSKRGSFFAVPEWNKRLLFMV